jgi:hypothetical protein
MSASLESERPSWAVPGTPVLVCNGKSAVRTSIGSVHERWFTVTDPLFGSWTFWFIKAASCLLAVGVYDYDNVVIPFRVIPLEQSDEGHE